MHELVTPASKKRKHEDADLANVISQHEGIVLLGDKAVVPRVARRMEPPAKVKKPKHIKRKIEQAASIADDSTRAEELLKVDKEKAQLNDYKKNAAKMWKKTCKKLVKKSLGEDKWDELLFESLVKSKMGKEAFLLALGVPSSMHNT